MSDWEVSKPRKKYVYAMAELLLMAIAPVRRRRYVVYTSKEEALQKFGVSEKDVASDERAELELMKKWKADAD